MDLLAQACRRRQEIRAAGPLDAPGRLPKTVIARVWPPVFSPSPATPPLLSKNWPDLRSVGKRCAWIRALTAGLTPRARVHAALRVVMAVTGFFAGAS